MSAPRAKKKRTPRQAWEEAQRAEKRAIATAVRERDDAREEPRWFDLRGEGARIPVSHPAPIRVPIRRGDN